MESVRSIIFITNNACNGKKLQIIFGFIGKKL